MATLYLTDAEKLRVLGELIDRLDVNGEDAAVAALRSIAADYRARTPAEIGRVLAAMTQQVQSANRNKSRIGHYDFGNLQAIAEGVLGALVADHQERAGEVRDLAHPVLSPRRKSMSDPILSQMLDYITKQVEGRVFAEMERNSARVELRRLREELAEARTVNANLAQEAESRGNSIDKLQREAVILREVLQRRLSALKNLKDAASDFITRVEHQPRSAKNIFSGEAEELRRRLEEAQREIPL